EAISYTIPVVEKDTSSKKGASAHGYFIYIPKLHILSEGARLVKGNKIPFQERNIFLIH
ncbi:hypothetical protein AAULR_14421, partial [Lacticaseibacillus rhamnosus MTCC 5462]